MRSREGPSSDPQARRAVHRGSPGQSGGDKRRRVRTGVLGSVAVNTEGKVEGKGLGEEGKHARERGLPCSPAIKPLQTTCEGPTASPYVKPPAFSSLNH